MPAISVVNRSMSACSVMPAAASFVPGDLVELDRDRVRLGRRFEAGDVPLEHEDVAHDVFGDEVEQHPSQVEDATARVVVGRKRFRSIEELAVALGEHRVVQVVLRREVRVERRLAQVDHGGELSQRDAAESVAMGEHPGRVEDLLALGLASPCSRVSSLDHR